jgi:hypothetical protein
MSVCTTSTGPAPPASRCAAIARRIGSSELPPPAAPRSATTNGAPAAGRGTAAAASASHA